MWIPADSVAGVQVSLSTDLISGFCEETEEDHQHTLDLVRSTGFDQAFMFAYSQRDRTHAARHLKVGNTALGLQPWAFCHEPSAIGLLPPAILLWAFCHGRFAVKRAVQL